MASDTVGQASPDGVHAIARPWLQRVSTRYLCGLAALLGVVTCWVGSSFAIQGMLTNYEYNKPCFLTYISTGTFIFYLAVYCTITPREKRHWHRHMEDDRERETDPLLSPGTNSAHPSSEAAIFNADSDDKKSDSESVVDPPSGMSMQHIAWLSARFCLLWFAGNWSQNASLAYTSVASSTVIGSSSGLFTLIIGAMVGKERVTVLRCSAAVCRQVEGTQKRNSCLTMVSASIHYSILTVSHLMSSMAGVAFVANAAGTSASPNGPSLASHLLGDMLALMGAFFYGCSTTLLRCHMHNETRADTMLFFGLVGLFCLLGMWPMLLLMHALGIEAFALPDVTSVWIIIMINAFFGSFLSDYLWLLAVLWTSPMVATLGLALSIPMALTGDIVFKGLVVGPGFWFGTLLVWLGFLGINGASLLE